MFENAILVVEIEETVNAYRVEHGVFNHVGNIPTGASNIVMDWIAKQGYRRVVAFDPDDTFSGLYAKEQA